MAFTPSFTQENLDILNEAIAQGVSTVMYGNKSVTYRSLDDMLRLRDRMMVELGKAKTPVRIYPKHSKGF